MVSRPGKMELSYWDMAGASFNVQDSSYYTYNASAKTLTTTVKYLGVNYIRNTITYDASGRQILDLRQTYDNATSAWINSTKAEKTFNTQGDVTSVVDATYDVATSTWQTTGGSQTTYLYNAQNLQTEVVKSQYNTGTSTFVPYSKYLNITYDASNKLTSYEEAEYISGVWENAVKWIFNYTTQTYPTSVELKLWEPVSSTYGNYIFGTDVLWESWNNAPENELTDGVIQTWNGTLYVNEEKYINTVLPNGGSENLQQVWDAATSTWVNDSRNLNAFDAQLNVTEYKNESFNAGSWVLNSRQLYTNTYAGIDLTQVIYQSYDQTTMIMVNQEKKVYDAFVSFDLTGVEEETISVSVYPNPMNDVLTISMENFSSLFLMDASGKIAISSDSNVVNTKELSAGVYFLNVVTTEGKLITSKVIKNL